MSPVTDWLALLRAEPPGDETSKIRRLAEQITGVTIARAGRITAIRTPERGWLVLGVFAVATYQGLGATMPEASAALLADLEARWPRA